VGRVSALIETSERFGVAFGVGSLLADHQISRIGRWIAQGNIGEIESVGVYSGTMGNVSGGAAPRFATLRILTGLDAVWAEGRELERRYTGYLERVRSEEVDGPICGRIGLENGLVCEIPDPDETDFTKKGIWIEGSLGSVSMGNDPKVFAGRGSNLRDVTDDVVGPPRSLLRFSFIPLISKLMRALNEGLELRPSGRDMRFALEVHPHPYQAFGGDVAGFQSLFPKYTAPSFENHLRQSYITDPAHEEALTNREV